MGREAWPAAIHGVTKSRTRLSDGTELIFYGRGNFPANNWENYSYYFQEEAGISRTGATRSLFGFL